MTTSSINHRPATLVAVTTTVVGALLTVTLTAAEAIPDRDALPAVAERTDHSHGHHAERGCFIEPPRWNEALDGPLPRCVTYVR